MREEQEGKRTFERGDWKGREGLQERGRGKVVHGNFVHGNFVQTFSFRGNFDHGNFVHGNFVQR